MDTIDTIQETQDVNVLFTLSRELAAAASAVDPALHYVVQRGRAIAYSKLATIQSRPATAHKSLQLIRGLKDRGVDLLEVHAASAEETCAAYEGNHSPMLWQQAIIELQVRAPREFAARRGSVRAPWFALVPALAQF